MTTEMLTPDEIKGLVNLVRDWMSWGVGMDGKIDDNLNIVIIHDYSSIQPAYKILVGEPNTFARDNYHICPVLGECNTSDERIHNLYEGVMKKAQDESDKEQVERVEHAREILRGAE